MNPSFSDCSNVEWGVPQRSISGLFFFNIFICDLLFDYIDIDLTNYADDTAPYAYNLANEKVIKTLEKILISYLIGSQMTF